MFRYERKNITTGNITEVELNSTTNSTEQDYLSDKSSSTQTVPEYEVFEDKVTSEMAEMTRIVNGEYCPPGECPWQVNNIPSTRL